MSSANVDLVLRLFDAFNRADASELHELWTEDGEWRPAYFGGGLVEGATYRGPEGLAEFIAQQAETWDRISATAVSAREVGDRVLTEVRLEAVGRTSGLELNESTWNVFEFRDGKAAGGRVYTTETAALAALGLTEQI